MSLRRRRPMDRARGRSPLAGPKGPTCYRCPRDATVARMWCTSCAEDVADVRVGSFVKRRDGHCISCGKKRDLTWAHIIPRRYRRIRWNPKNAVALCWPCHDFLDSHPVNKRGFFRAKYPGLLEELEQLKDSAPPVDLVEILTTYRVAA